MLRHDFLVALAQSDHVGSAGLAAEQTRRTGAAMLHEEGRLALAAQHLHPIAHAEATAELASATGPLAQRICLEDERVTLLKDLDRLRFGDADRRAAIAEPVSRPPAAVAAAREKIHDVIAPFRRIVAAEAEIAAGAGGRGEQTLRD